VDIRELGRLDMNLLVALEALLEERNVSRAAERLYITQSAMSKTLGRLRELFDDPLFIRKAGGMVPTPRALQLAGHLPALLQAVQAMIRPVEFDPLTYDGEFELMVQGHMGVWILPLLLQRLRQSAPHVRLRTLSACEAPLDMLAAGELDFVLHAEHKVYQDGFRLTTLGYAPPVLLARKGHPLEGTPLTWETLQQYPHVRLIIPELEDTSDSLFPAPPLFMEQDELAKDLVALPLPGGEEISIKYVMVSHERVDDSAAHQFLRGEILYIIGHFREKYGLPCLDDLRALNKLSY